MTDFLLLRALHLRSRCDKKARRTRHGKSSRVPALRLIGAMAALTLAACVVATPAAADRIKHSIGVYAGLDKITGRIISFEVASNETVQFGSLQITERACYTRPPTETPQTTSFVEVDDIDASNNYKRIFSGWMFASSPGLHAIEHPVYDVWLVDCKGTTELIPSPPDTAALDQAPPPTPDVAKPDATKPPPPPKPKPARRKPVETDDALAPPVDVPPPPGFPQTERRTPSQRYYPTNPPGPAPF